MSRLESSLEFRGGEGVIRGGRVQPSRSGAETWGRVPSDFLGVLIGRRSVKHGQTCPCSRTHSEDMMARCAC